MDEHNLRDGHNEKECCKAGCTTGEVSGVKRLGIGLTYDPLGVLEYPFA